MKQSTAPAAGDWWVYMLRCADGSLYTGVTTDVLRRWQEHNDGPRGARYTRARRPVALVMCVAVPGRAAAGRPGHAHGLPSERFRLPLRAARPSRITRTASARSRRRPGGRA
ncbi:GIY-YIG nuclease family protein, partial [Alloalcanivorax venustensis]|uniref:GIY-YIG nuclease family protein n=1 Tax=Alloalcanivorax venustensis TaxID=172371 RepID=UPI003C4671A2